MQRVMTSERFLQAIGEPHLGGPRCLKVHRYRAYVNAYQAPSLLSLVLQAIHAGPCKGAIRLAASDRDAGLAMIECPALKRKEE